MNRCQAKNSTFDKDFPKRLELLRKYVALNQKEFAARIHFSRSLVNEVEKGKTPPSERFIASICLIFAIDEAWLRWGKNSMFDSSIQSEEPHVDVSSDGGTQLPNRYRAYPMKFHPLLDAVVEIMRSDSDLVKSALESNIDAFRHQIRQKKEMDNLKRRVEALEKPDCTIKKSTM